MNAANAKMMMKGMLSMEMAQMLVAAENKQRKRMILCQATCAGIICLVFMSLYFARFDSVARSQADSEDIYDEFVWKDYYGNNRLSFKMDEVVAYDLGCLQPRYSPTGTIIWPDSKDAQELLKEINSNSVCDEDCKKVGTQWSVVYTMMGSLMVLLIVNMIIVCVGAYKATARLIGGLCGCCLCCVHLAFIIVTAVIRFSKKSQLCALNKSSTNYTGVKEETILNVTADFP